MKARWLASKYRLPYDRAYKVLDQTVLKEPIYPFEYEPDEVDTDALLYYLRFELDLQEGIRLLGAHNALELFENESSDFIKETLAKQA